MGDPLRNEGGRGEGGRELEGGRMGERVVEGGREGGNPQKLGPSIRSPYLG